MIPGKHVLLPPTLYNVVISTGAVQTGDKTFIPEPPPPKIQPRYAGRKAPLAAKTHPVRWRKPK